MLSVNNIELEKFKEKFPNVSLFQGDKTYFLNLNEETIGYGIINENNKYHEIKIYIIDNNRGNGYGTYLFSEMVKLLNKQIRIAVDINNYLMTRIITRCGGKELGRDGKEIYYLIQNNGNNI